MHVGYRSCSDNYFGKLELNYLDFKDQIPAYCSLIEMGSALGNNNKALFYEKKSLNIIRENLGTDEQVDPLGLLTSANLFQTLSNSR